MLKISSIPTWAINPSFTFSFRNRNLITDLYQYYFYNGYHSIIIEKVSRVAISFLMIFLANMLVNCIDYSALVSLAADSSSTASGTSIFQYIHLSRWLSFNPYLLICFIIYCIYLLCITLNLVASIRKFGKIKAIYNKYLAINDYRLKFITWDDIVGKISQRLAIPRSPLNKLYVDMLDTSNVTIYTINNKICHQSNYIISLLRGGYITLPRYSKFLEWNYIFCMVEPITSPIVTIAPRANPIQSPRTDATLSDTLDDITNFDNVDIYQRYNQPLLTQVEIEEIKSYDYPTLYPIQISHSKGRDYLDAILLDTSSSLDNSLITSTDRSPQPTIFDSVLYNTLSTPALTSQSNDTIHNNHNPNMPLDNIPIKEYLARVRYRLVLVFWLNILAMPFTIIILGLYAFIRYGEKIYGNPGLLFQRQLDITTRWRLRYYNELPNLYRDRVTRITRNMDKIINTYRSPVNEILTRFATFLVGSVFLVLLVISFIATEEFVKLEVVPNHNVIWFLGVCGTLLLILNKASITSDTSTSTGGKLTKAEQMAAFDALREDLITINPNLLKTDDREYLVTLIQDIYKPRIVNLAYEVVNLFMAPYYLWKWRGELATHASNIIALQENHYILGWVCRHSIFTNRDELLNNPHMLLSLKEFKSNHNWEIPPALGLDMQLSNSVLLATVNGSGDGDGIVDIF